MSVIPREMRAVDDDMALCPSHRDLKLVVLRMGHGVEAL
jgi:hypothetical protein